MSDENPPATEPVKRWKIYFALVWLVLHGSVRDVLEVLVTRARWDEGGKRYTRFLSQVEIARKKDISKHAIPRLIRIVEKMNFVRKKKHVPRVVESGGRRFG
jgi:hypothetical protein